MTEKKELARIGCRRHLKGKDVVLVEWQAPSHYAELVIDFHLNGTSESVLLDRTDMLALARALDRAIKRKL